MIKNELKMSTLLKLNSLSFQAFCSWRSDFVLLCQVQFSLVYVELHLEVKGRFDLMAIIFFTLQLLTQINLEKSMSLL